MDFELNLVGY